ncbi:MULTISPECIES: saccharopine dehydrogenase family protein [Oceanobacillus]|uniref:Saccharopine dehydrogenase n=1 Tax=Oceanobacillus sojae TaxID=582851 RepID=A0A511ZPT5_9BACI|nr:saccharopine dehydrogenase C-terminal domain-containing protein [Oceanobacillus sojae]GEN89470.1 saccharopine dehydrogenase [Oceanobacillus sojae]
MKIGVLGTGLMGKEVARDLAGSDGISDIGLADIDLQRAQDICYQLQSPLMTAYQVNAKNEDELADFMSRFDVVVNALFYTFNEVVAKTGIKVGTSVVDLGGHIDHITDKVLDLEGEARAAGVTIIPDLGVAPGMINILSGYGVSKLEKAASIQLFVGGIPVHPEDPLKYNHVFSMEGVLDHYTDPSEIIRENKLITVPSLSEIESIEFDDFDELEAFHTSGGTSTLTKSFPFLETLEYKTIRYPGHAEKFKLLVDLNLTRNNYEVVVDGLQISPRKVLLKVLDPIVDLKDKEDAVLLRAIITGYNKQVKTQFTYEMTTYKDQQTGVTAMARATANTISVAAQMIADGTITKKGVYPPEKIIPGEAYIGEMAKRGVIIKEKISMENHSTIS